MTDKEKENAELARKLKIETELSKRLGVANREYEQLTKEQDEHLAELEMTVGTLRTFSNEQATCIEKLEAQIEKMKCCSNCDNWNWKHSKCEKKLKGDCFKQSKWILRR